ncbi:hypothetical protein BH11BAC2_BH11BAC2_09440 [soil metagenome]
MNVKQELVSFFIVGAPKAGTTSLYHYLESHPQVCMCSIKEPNFFSAEGLNNEPLYYEDPIISDANEYAQLFNHCQLDSIKGEASVSYLFYPNTAAKIKAYNPSAKIIIILRDPAKRAFSHWKMDERLGFVKKSLEQIIAEHHPGKFEPHYQQYVELGFYAKQIKRYKESFPENQLLIMFQKDLRTSQTEMLQQLYHFLAISEDHFPSEEEHNTAVKFKNPLLAALYTNKIIRSVAKKILPSNASSKLKSDLSEKDERNPSPLLMKDLYALYKDDIVELETILKISLSDWKHQ